MAALASVIAKRERGQKGRVKGGKATPEQKHDRLQTDVVCKRSEPQPETSRKSASKTARVSERKIRQAGLMLRVPGVEGNPAGARGLHAVAVLLRPAEEGGDGQTGVAFIPSRINPITATALLVIDRR